MLRRLSNACALGCDVIRGLESDSAMDMSRLDLLSMPEERRDVRSWSQRARTALQPPSSADRWARRVTANGILFVKSRIVRRSVSSMCISSAISIKVRRLIVEKVVVVFQAKLASRRGSCRSYSMRTRVTLFPRDSENFCSRRINLCIIVYCTSSSNPHRHHHVSSRNTLISACPSPDSSQ